MAPGGRRKPEEGDECSLLNSRNRPGKRFGQEEDVKTQVSKPAVPKQLPNQSEFHSDVKTGGPLSETGARQTQRRDPRCAEWVILRTT